MRVQVYAQEMTSEVQEIRKVADTGRTYYGIRVILRSPQTLHHGPEDDDRSAVTFWADDEDFDLVQLSTLFTEMATRARHMHAMEERDAGSHTR